MSRPLSTVEQDAVIQLEAAGLPYKDIAVQVNRSTGSVCSILRNLRKKGLIKTQRAASPSDQPEWCECSYDPDAKVLADNPRRKVNRWGCQRCIDLQANLCEGHRSGYNNTVDAEAPVMEPYVCHAPFSLQFH